MRNGIFVIYLFCVDFDVLYVVVDPVLFVVEQPMFLDSYDVMFFQECLYRYWVLLLVFCMFMLAMESVLDQL